MHHISKVSFKIIFVSLRCVFVNNKCSEVAAEICSRLAIEVMLGNSMGDIFFSQSVFERLCVCVWGFFFPSVHAGVHSGFKLCSSDTIAQLKTSCNTVPFVFQGCCLF